VVAGTRLDFQDTHYREGAACLQTGSGFFRVQSRPSRDLSVLLAAHQAARATGPQHWLDLMAGCGIRGLRWGLESATQSRHPLALWLNDADPERMDHLEANLKPLSGHSSVDLSLTQQPAERLLRQAYLDQRRFDLIDLDAFGCPNSLLQSALSVLRFGGVLILASTDGRSPTGHDRVAAVRRFAAAARAHPSSWELALRLQLAALAREAWVMGHGLEPLVCFSDGRTFRLAVRLHRRVAAGEENNLGVLARCDQCGDQAVQPVLKLCGWRACACLPDAGRWAVSGPLWVGPLQSPVLLEQLLILSEAMPGTLAPSSRRLLERLQGDPGLPVCCWSTDELAQRLGLAGPPPLRRLVQSLQDGGYQACVSGVMTGQLRTDAPLKVLLQRCADLG